MVDSRGKGSESSEEASPNSAAKSPSHSGEQKKTCADCGTSKTPLWRGGPAGPKSLCNACGIRSRKKKRAILGITKGTGDDPKKGKRSSNNNNKVKLGVGGGGGGGGGGDSLNLKQRLWALGRQVLMQRSNHSHSHSHRNKLGEEEQAAVLLMSLSYGSVYA